MSNNTTNSGKASLRDITNNIPKSPDEKAAEQARLSASPQQGPSPSAQRPTLDKIEIVRSNPIDIPWPPGVRHHFTADDLKYFAEKETFPFKDEPRRWLKDYRFNELHHPDEKKDLLRVFDEVFRTCRARPHDVHRWRNDSKLGDKICALFEMRKAIIDHRLLDFANKNKDFLNGRRPPVTRPPEPVQPAGSSKHADAAQRPGVPVHPRLAAAATPQSSSNSSQSEDPIPFRRERSISPGLMFQFDSFSRPNDSGRGNK